MLACRGRLLRVRSEDALTSEEQWRVARPARVLAVLLAGWSLQGCANLDVSDSRAQARIKTLEARLDAQEKALAILTADSPKFHPTWLRIPVGLNGSEVCGQQGLSCIAVKSSNTYDRRAEFCGHTIADCNARVVQQPWCMQTVSGEVLNYALIPTRFVRAPKAMGRCGGEGWAQLCLPDAWYDTAMCISPAEAAPTNITSNAPDETGRAAAAASAAASPASTPVPPALATHPRGASQRKPPLCWGGPLQTDLVACSRLTEGERELSAWTEAQRHPPAPVPAVPAQGKKTQSGNYVPPPSEWFK